ncbi:MAG: hypothetical protein GVY13_18650 [Alphaproteobacteria bacterium]|jgi:histidine phosphotransferase ChpT|nr:hypothetical protein [Alphaproteobacteria bacterium]
MVDLRVSELLCSRLCHELVSPVGAINNGIELIEELGDDMVGEAMGLVRQSGQRAAALLALYRLAYGAAGASTSGHLSDMRDIAVRYLSYGKCRLDWDLPDDAAGHLPDGAVKVILNLVVLAEDALVHGGTIAVGLARTPAPGRLTVTARGDRVGLDEAARHALSPEADPAGLTARTVHPFVTSLFARTYGLPLGMADTADGALLFSLGLPAG